MSRMNNINNKAMVSIVKYFYAEFLGDNTTEEELIRKFNMLKDVELYEDKIIVPITRINVRSIKDGTWHKNMDASCHIFNLNGELIMKGISYKNIIG